MANKFVNNVHRSFLVQPVGVAPILEHLANDVLGFTRVGVHTTIPDKELREIAIEWATGQHEKRRHNTDQIAKLLCKFSWSWAAFESMSRILLRDDLWPMPWHHYEENLKLGQKTEEIRAKILIQTARAASASIRLSKSKSFLTMISLDGWHLYTDSEVGAHYVKMFSENVQPSDYTTWPPLYPGDLSTIKSGGDGVHSRFGRFFGLGVSRPFWADPQ